MIMPLIETLRKANWAVSSPEQRVEALNQLEKWVARQDGREPCPVSSEPLDRTTRGHHEYFADGREAIGLNESLVNADEPYQAVETLLHEGRHSYQVHVVKHPELAENDQQLQDWSMAHEGGYIQPNSLEPSKYRVQPTELDARATARERTDNLYESVLQDEEYGAYKAQKLQEEAGYIEDARYELGENYEQIARQAVADRYQQQQQMNMAESTQSGSDNTETREQKSPDVGMDSVNAGSQKDQTRVQESPLSYETYNQLRDNDLNYYEQLRDYAAEMEKKGLTDVVEEQKQEMSQTSERLDSLLQERNQIYDQTGEPLEQPLAQENKSNDAGQLPDQATKVESSESLDQASEQSLETEELPAENAGEESAQKEALQDPNLEKKITENVPAEELGESAVEETVASTLVDGAEASVAVAVPEASEVVENLSQAMETPEPEVLPTSDAGPDSNKESEDESYRYGVGF